MPNVSLKHEGTSINLSKNQQICHSRRKIPDLDDHTERLKVPWTYDIITLRWKRADTSVIEI